MAKQGSFIQRIQAEKQVSIKATCDTYTQFMFDMLAVAAAREFGFGPTRCKRLLDAVQELSDTYHDALGYRNKAERLAGETEYLREKLDEELKQALGEHFEMPFEKRYLWIQKIKY